MTPIAPPATKSSSRDDELPTIAEALGISIGSGRSGEPTNIAEHKDEYIAEAILPSRSDDELEEADDLGGKPVTMDDPLWNIIGIGRSDGPTDVARNKYKNLAEAYLDYKERPLDLLTVEETAQLLRVSPVTIRRYITSGRLESERVGRGIRVRREAIDQFIKSTAPRSGDPGLRSGKESMTLREAVGNIIGIGRSDGPTDISSNKYKYVAEAYWSDQE
jgi:excisionase family DNA binding protein